MEWNLFTYLDSLDKKTNEIKKYSCKEYREYIKENFKAEYNNKVFYNILISKYFSHDWYNSTITPKEQLQYFKSLYSTFCHHFQNEDITIFSFKTKYENSETEYHIFVHVHDDFIIEFPSIKDLFKDTIQIPAACITWYKENGTFAENYLNLSNEESFTWHNFVQCAGEIINPKETPNFNFYEWWKDRREYFFFYKLKIHKYGKYGRVFDKHTYDCFADYTFKLVDLINYFHDLGKDN